MIEGEPTIMINNSKILDRNLLRVRYTIDDLMKQLREKNVFDPGQVEYAILETNGKLSVLLKTQFQPVTAQTLNVPTPYQGMGTTLITSSNRT